MYIVHVSQENCTGIELVRCDIVTSLLVNKALKFGGFYWDNSV